MLFHTGTQSKDFVLVLATNRPADLDFAVVDRIEQNDEFPLPEFEEKEVTEAVLRYAVSREPCFWNADNVEWD